MNTLIVIISCLLAGAFAVYCPGMTKYSKKLNEDLICKSKDYQGILWPNYKNLTQYYRCQENIAVLESCPSLYSVFNYALQSCSRCDRYIRAPECEDIRKGDCVACPDCTFPEEEKIECNIVTPTYKLKFEPTCKGSDIYRFWPVYDKDVTKNYYYCLTENKAKLKTCPDGKYFNYFQQNCVDCSLYVPPPPCENLKFDKSNKCTNNSNKK